jgi:hypothetical protein
MQLAQAAVVLGYRSVPKSVHPTAIIARDP